MFSSSKNYRRTALRLLNHPHLMIPSPVTLLFQRTDGWWEKRAAGSAEAHSNKLRTKEVLVLEAASRFLVDRAQATDFSVEFLTENAVGYECEGATNVVDFIRKRVFQWPVSSIMPVTTPGFCAVEVKYDLCSNVYGEMLVFDENSMQIVGIQTTYFGSFPSDIPRRDRLPTEPLGPDLAQLSRALHSVNLLRTACRFLVADLTQDLEEQARLLADDAVAFGCRGKDQVIEAQREGVASGVTYTVPFPLQVNCDANCVSLDFYAHYASTKVAQRGTDIMYVDVENEKILRIDTLRHTLQQPPWVKAHFGIQIACA